MFDRIKTITDDIRSAFTQTIIASHAGDPAGQLPAKIIFRVDDVTPAANPLWASTLRESLEMRSGNTILIMPEGDLPALAPEGYFVPGARRGTPLTPDAVWAPLRQLSLRTGKGAPGTLRQDSDQSDSSAVFKRMAAYGPMLNPLVQAVHLAFSQHRPLILSPDSIWLTIVLGFGHHVYENAETLRDRIVHREGTRSLVVMTNSLNAEHWPHLIGQISTAIRDNSNQVLYENLMCKFSTTTPHIQTAMEIALMDVYERYFDYIMMCVCGIPKITLQGTPADWRLMRERIEVLGTYDLTWWTDRVAPILDEFIATAEGRPDLKFWQSIYKPKEAYGAEVATGWITDLFPYLGDRPERRRNDTLERLRENWILIYDREDDYMYSGPGVKLNSFPCGLSRAPVKIKIKFTGLEKDVEVIGGFAGIGQDTDDCAVYPIISWAVAEKSVPPEQNLALQSQDLLQKELTWD